MRGTSANIPEDTVVLSLNQLCRLCLIWSLCVLLFPTFGTARVSVNLPLDDPAYPLLEKLTSSGLTFTNALTLKPITRLHAARLVAEAIEQRRRELEVARWQEPFLDEVLEYLASRFKRELQQLGFLTYLGRRRPFFLAPLSELKLNMVFASNPFIHRDSSGETTNLQGVFSLNNGFSYGDDFTLRTGSISWLTLWNTAALYVEPRTIIRTDPLLGEDTFDVDLHRLYIKAEYANLELALGRDTPSWGPAVQGDLVLSPNAPPLDGLKFGTPMPFRLPGVFKEAGEWQMTYFVARLEDDRDFPHALLSGIRFAYQPVSYLKFGFTNAFMALGEGGVHLDPWEYARRLFVPEFDTAGRTVNSVVAYDVVLTVPFVRDWIWVKGVKLYWQKGHDNRRDIDGILGGGNILGGVLDGGRWDLRAEFAETRDQGAVWYAHPTYRNGFAFKDFFIGHPIGGVAQGWFARATYYLTPTAWVAADGRYEQYGVDEPATETIQQRFGLEGSYQLPWLQRDLVLWGRVEYATLDEPATAYQRAFTAQLSARWRF
jgi:hypothetical protein